jgi:glycosyltransferase involved in cell wall biosynthesis
MSARILVVAHNHPAFHPGGTEVFAYDLFKAYKKLGFEAMFLAATNRIYRELHPGTSFQTIGDAADEVLVWAGHFDRFMMSQTDLHGIVPDYVSLLEQFRPDVVHLHHLLLVGVEFPALVRRICPNATIALTLHDYYPICAHDGLMVRRQEKDRCLAAEPNRCHGCFPEIPANSFLLRELNLKAHLSVIDRFIAPSQFLKDRYVEWGIPADRIALIRNGRDRAEPAPYRRSDGRRNVFGYFGNLNPWKGVPVLLEAAERLCRQGVDFELRVHGSALFQREEFAHEIDARFARTQESVVRLGRYSHEELPALMEAVDWVVAPSIWWENAPLVILEAQAHGRPVITSRIGGMAEYVADGRDGLLANPNDPADLARIMKTCAIDNTRMWERLAKSVTPPSPMENVAASHADLFVLPQLRCAEEAA